jgi:uncharacterized protein
MATVHDLDALVAAVHERSTGRASHHHGEPHWQLVGWVGAQLAPEEPAADPAVVFLFALFHDSMRDNDGWDPDHGARGAALAQELWPRFRFGSVDQMETLAHACNEHTNGETSDEPTIAVCWDADRLNLWRVGTEPHPRLLSTDEARKPQRIAWARDVQVERRSWREVAAALGLSG